MRTHRLPPPGGLFARHTATPGPSSTRRRRSTARPHNPVPHPLTLEAAAAAASHRWGRQNATSFRKTGEGTARSTAWSRVQESAATLPSPEHQCHLHSPPAPPGSRSSSGAAIQAAAADMAPSNGAEYIDVAPLLAAAAAALPEHDVPGTVVHGEAFSLYEAMSAVEIGNAKMDVGMQAAPQPLEALLAGGAAPTELNARERLAVVDRLMQMEMTWHTGGSLANTVFSCLYMLKPERWVRQ
eukprot:364034-Chlamydomonas_euryale.AAC.1